MSMHELGARMEEIAAATGLDAGDIDRHFLKCIPPSDTVDPRSASDAELNSLLRHATELYYGATLQNNLVAASSSLGVRLRCIAEIGQREAARAERAGLLDGVDPVNTPLSEWPKELAAFTRAYLDGIVERAAAAEKAAEGEYVEN